MNNLIASAFVFILASTGFYFRDHGQDKEQLQNESSRDIASTSYAIEDIIAEYDDTSLDKTPVNPLSLDKILNNLRV